MLLVNIIFAAIGNPLKFPGELTALKPDPTLFKVVAEAEKVDKLSKSRAVNRAALKNSRRR